MRAVTARWVNTGSRLRERPEVGLESSLLERLVRGREAEIHEPGVMLIQDEVFWALTV